MIRELRGLWDPFTREIGSEVLLYKSILVNISVRCYGIRVVWLETA
jgi:hypothetical protein